MIWKRLNPKQKNDIHTPVSMKDIKTHQLILRLLISFNSLHFMLLTSMKWMKLCKLSQKVCKKFAYAYKVLHRLA